MIIKEQPEDFLVREHWIPSFSAGPHAVYLLRKKQYNTEDCLQWLSQKLNVPRKNIGCCGNKDKQAITEQYITIKGGPKYISTPSDFSVTYLGTRAEPLHMGEHSRNFFIITVNGISTKKEATAVKNFYGEQRFGANNIEVGLALLQKNYKRAAELLNLPTNTDPIREIKTVPRHTLMLYVHAVQSELWNELVGTLPAEQDDVPIIGFGPTGNQKYLALYEPLLQKYNLNYDSWINRSIGELSVEGGSRPLLQDLKDVTCSNINNGTCTFSFSLGKGSYATETLKQLVE